MYCRKCGQKLADGDKFCSACGSKVENSPSEQQAAAKGTGFVNHPEEDNIERPAPFSFSTEDLFPKKEKKADAPKDPEPIAPVEDFDWNIHSFPGMKVEKTEDIDFQWDSELLNEDSLEKSIAPEPTVADKLSRGIGDIPVEVPEMSGETAKEPGAGSTLFGGLDSKTEAAKKESEKIDKFFTFNQKNEEFQRLLDQEYEKIKSGNILEKELTAAEASSREKFEAIQPKDSMEDLFKTEGIIKGYQPKEIQSDVLERIEAADNAKAAREKQEEELQKQQGGAEAEGISITEVAEAMKDDDAAEKTADVLSDEPLNIQELFKAAEADEPEEPEEPVAASEIEPEEFQAEMAEEESAEITEPVESAEPEEVVLPQEELFAAEEPAPEVLEVSEAEEIEEIAPAGEETEEIHIAAAEEAGENEAEPAAEIIELSDDEGLFDGSFDEIDEKELTPAPAEQELDEELMFKHPDSEEKEPDFGLPENSADESLHIFEKAAAEKAETAPAENGADEPALEIEIPKPEESVLEAEPVSPQEISMEDFLAGELTDEKPIELDFAPIDREAEAAHLAAMEKERRQVTTAAEEAIAEAKEKAAIARKELEEAAAKEEKMLRERYTSADHLTEMAKAREAFFTEDYGAEFKEQVKSGIFDGSPKQREPEEKAAAEAAAEYIRKPEEETVSVSAEPAETAEFFEPAPAAAEPEAEIEPEPAVFDGPLEIDFNQVPEPEEELGQTRAFDKEAILAGMAAATRIVEQDKISEAQDKLEQEKTAEGNEPIDAFGFASAENGEAEESAEPQQKSVTADTMVMSEHALAEILEQANLEVPEDMGSEEAEEAVEADETQEEIQMQDEPEFFSAEELDFREVSDMQDVQDFDFSEAEYEEPAPAEPDFYEPVQEFAETAERQWQGEEEIPQAAEEQWQEEGQVPPFADEQFGVNDGGAAADFDLSAADLANEDFDEYDEEEGGKGRIVLKVVLVILILLLALEIAGVVIKITAPTSDAANFIDTQLNKVIQKVTGEETEYSVIAATEPIRTDSPADKTEMIQKEIDKNSGGNIQTIKYNGALAFDSSRTYEEGDLSLTQNLTDIFWYKDEENKPVYYDEAVVGGIIAFESQRMNLINNKDKGVLSLVRKGTEFYEELEKLANGDNRTQTFRTLEIGEIREAGTAFYVWVSEEIDGNADGTEDGTAANKVYMLEPDGKLMKVVDCYSV